MVEPSAPPPAGGTPYPAAAEPADDHTTMDGPPRPAALDPPMVPFAVGGLIAWAVAGLVLLVFFRGWLTRTGHTDWLWICLAGFLTGLLGLAVMMRHDARRRRRHDGS